MRNYNLTYKFIFSFVCKAKRSNTCRFDLLDDGCSINKDCDTIRCKTKLMDKAITCKLQVFVFVDFFEFLYQSCYSFERREDIRVLI